MKKASVILLMSFGLLSDAFSNECVILLHGLARSSSSMNPVARFLNKKGYEVINVNYPSTNAPIEKLASEFIDLGIKKCEGFKKIHFVTHSMGGILVRHYMKNKSHPKNLGHVVMLAPPNKGSELVNALKDIPGYDWWNGPSGRQLGIDPDSVPNRLGPVAFSLGVVAGDRKTVLFSRFINGPNDGKVSVESSKVLGMSDHVTVHSSHTFIMRSPKVKNHILSFLKKGKF